MLRDLDSADESASDGDGSSEECGRRVNGDYIHFLNAFDQEPRLKEVGWG